MVSIKKQKVKAYILLESLVALGLFVTITTLILTQLSHYQERTAKNLQKQEILNLAIMALQTQQDHLSFNGVSVTVVKNQGETIAGSVSVYNGLTKAISSNIHYLSKNQEDAWLLFCQQFRSELEGTTLQKLDSNKLYIQKNNQSLAFGKSKASDFRKTNSDGRGYQPMLTEIKAANFSQSGKIIKLDLTFKDGLERTFVYAFHEKN